MIVIRNCLELKSQIAEWKREGISIGFVPTMGYLHEGHISLFNASKESTDKTVLSIFVNPEQFNETEDYIKYPSDTEGDLKKCQDAGVDLVFLPTKETIYPESSGSITLSQPMLQKNLCGRTRLGHFEGVMLVLTKLFHLISPNKAFFGLKDYQQFRIIQDMVSLLDFSIEIIGIETLREKDGLAMSSRNSRLSEKEREVASLIPRMFSIAQKLIRDGEKNLRTYREKLSEFLLTGQNSRIDYLETVDPTSLQEILAMEADFLLGVAVFVGKTRLIDNRIISIN